MEAEIAPAPVGVTSEISRLERTAATRQSRMVSSVENCGKETGGCSGRPLSFSIKDVAQEGWVVNTHINAWEIEERDRLFTTKGNGS